MAYRSSNNASTTASVTSIDVAAPSGTAAGDVLVCSAVNDATSITITLPTGCRQLPSSPKTSTNDNALQACGLLSEEGTPPANYTFTQSSGSAVAATVAAYSGWETDDPHHASSGNSTNTGGASPRDIDATGITTTIQCDLVWCGSGDWTVSDGSQTYAPPSGYSERQDFSNGGFVSLSLADKENQAAQATGTVTGTTSASGGTAGFTVFLIAGRLSGQTLFPATTSGGVPSMSFGGGM